MKNPWLATRNRTGKEYDSQYEVREAAGFDVHGEANLVEQLLKSDRNQTASPVPWRVLDAGCGTGRSTGWRTSGPPASEGSIAIIVVGIPVIFLSVTPDLFRRPLSGLACRLRHGGCRNKSGMTKIGRHHPHFIDRLRPLVNDPPMDLDDILPKNPGDPLVALTKQDLDPFSVDELTARIATLEAEIARARAKIDYAVNQRANAESLFKR